MGAGGSKDADMFNCASGFDCFSTGPPPMQRPGQAPEAVRETRMKISAQDAAARAKAEYDRTRTIDKLVQYSRSNDASGIELLCEYMGAFAFLDDLGVDGYAAIHVAAVHGKADAMNELIKRGCSLDTLSKEGKTAEQYAKEFGNEDLLVLISKARANKQAIRQSAMTPGLAAPAATPTADGKELFNTTPATQGMEGNPQGIPGESPMNATRKTPASAGSNTSTASKNSDMAAFMRQGTFSPAFAVMNEPKSRPTNRKQVSLTRTQISKSDGGTGQGPSLNSAKGNGGVGISFGITAGGTTFITGMAPGGPAEVSGKLFVGDELISVNGINVSERKVDDVIGLIVGEPGTMLTLDIASDKPDPDSGSKITPVDLQALASVQQ